MKLRLRYTALFEVELDVPQTITLRELNEKLMDVPIPEGQGVKYVPDTFEGRRDQKGFPLIFNEEGQEVRLDTIKVAEQFAAQRPAVARDPLAGNGPGGRFTGGEEGGADDLDR